MLFSIDADLGDQIIGWLMPDNPTATPVIKVRLDANSFTIVATVFRPLLKEQGLHSHGICGFVVDSHTCPGLSAAQDVEITEAATGVLVYRRRASLPNINGKLLRIETQLAALQSLDRVLSPYFQMAYPAFETIPQETGAAILRIGFSSSMYVAGRVLPRSIDDLARSRLFRLAIVLRDPFEELAERLILMRWSASKPKDVVQSLLGESVADAAPMLTRVDFDSAQSLQRDLPLLDAEARARFLANPLFRQLTCVEAFDEPADEGVGQCLEYLSTFDAIGLRDDLVGVQEILGALLDTDEPLPPIRAPISETTARVRDHLRQVPYAHTLIDKDLKIYAAVRQALGA